VVEDGGSDDAPLLMTPPLDCERRDGVAWCTLTRPPLNLLEPGLIGAIRETFQTLGADRTIRAAVVTGSGRAFTAGMDVHVLAGLDVASARALITTLHDAIEAVHHAPFPVIAAVNGPCLGAGFELALACDLRVAAATATLGLPEVRVGVPSVIEAALLPPLVGPGRASQLLLTGEAVGAETALAWGLVNEVTPPAELTAAVERLVAKILAAGPTAIRLQKELMLRWRYTDLGTAIRYGINAFAAAYASGEPAEGAAAFLAKRAPKFEASP
jgi:enoyl-CoA hydratase